MFINCKLVMLILVLTLNGQVHTIFGGHEALPHSRPYMVLLERDMQDGTKSHCGGFLLTEDFVMTAAHCNASSYKVFLGVHNAYKLSETQTRYVAHGFPHEDYDATDFKNNIMLLKLSSKASVNKNVKTIALAGQDDGSLPKSCLILGWGRSDRNKKHMSHALMEANVTLIDSEKCPKEKSYCTEGETGPGDGDSGGPLVCEDGKAYGVVSSYKSNPNGLHIYSYTKIPDYRSWIYKIVVNAVDSTIENTWKCM